MQIFSNIHIFYSELMTLKRGVFWFHIVKIINVSATSIFFCGFFTTIFESSLILHSIPLNVKFIIMPCKWALLQNNWTLNVWIVNVWIMNIISHFSCIRVFDDNLSYEVDIFNFSILDFHILFYHIFLFSTSVFWFLQLFKVMSLSQNVILQSKDHLFFFSHD